jgi:putative membrane protein
MGSELGAGMGEIIQEIEECYDPAMGFLLRVLLNGMAIVAAAFLVPGMHVTGPVPALIAGLVLGLVNALVRPILVILTLPFTLITLGLFLFVVNTICLALTAALVPGFGISGFFAAFFGALIVTIVSWILSALTRDGDHR